MNNSVKAAMFFLLGSILWLVFYMNILKPNNTPVVEETNTNQLLVENQKLKSENDSLIAELHQTNQLFDKKEKKYIEIIARYEYGIDWVKSYHRNTYEEFHRILAFKETYSREDEVQTKKELKDY
jgi:cell division protein FtsB